MGAFYILPTWTVYYTYVYNAEQSHTLDQWGMSLQATSASLRAFS